MGTAELIIWAGVICFFAGSWLTGRFAPAAAVVFPVLWLLVVIALVVHGEARAVRDLLLAAVGLLVLMIAAGSGTSRRKHAEARRPSGPDPTGPHQQ